MFYLVFIETLKVVVTKKELKFLVLIGNYEYKSKVGLRTWLLFKPLYRGEKRNLGKPDKQRLINAIIGKPVDRVPNFEILYEDKVLEKVLGRNLGGDTLGGIREDSISENALEKAQKYYEDDEIDKLLFITYSPACFSISR